MEASAESSEEGQAGPARRLTADDQRATAAELLASIAVALWLSRSFWLPGRYVVGFDTVAYSGPNFDVTVESWRAGRLPLWNEYVFGGVVHLGNPQAGALYPPKLIGLLFDTNRAMGVLVASHLLLLAIGTVLFVRRLGCRPPAGFAAALVMCANGAVLTRTIQFEQILVLAWAPLLVLGITAVLSATARPWLAMAGTGLVTVMVLLAGHPQIVYQLAFVGGVWTAAELVRTHRGTRSEPPDDTSPMSWQPGSWRRLTDLGAAVAIGAAVATPQLVAALAATRDSAIGLGRSLEQLEDPSLSSQPHRLVEILFGSVRGVNEAFFAGGFETIGHVGVVAAFAAVVGIVAAARRRATRASACAVGALAVLGVVWALGPRTPIFTIAYNVLPGFDLARGSARWLDITAIATAIGVAWAVEAVADRWPLDAGALAASAMFVGALLLGPADVVDLPDRGTFVPWVAAALAVAATFVVVVRRRATWAVAALVVLLVVELGATSRYSVIDATTQATSIDKLPAGVAGELAGRPGLTMALTDDLLGDPAYLVAGFRPNTNVLADVASLDGYDGGVQVTDRFVALGETTGPGVDPALPLRNKLPVSWMPADAARWGVRYVVLDNDRNAQESLPGWRRTDLVGPEFTVWENPAWLGDAVGRLDDGREVALAYERRSPTHLVVTVDDPSAMRVIVHRQIAPGWRVEVDGDAGRLIDVDGFFLGVDVPAGTRTVEFSYRPRWVTPSLAVSSIGILALASCLGFGLRGRAGRFKVLR
ncbi:MAG TPA: hypothetical protein VFV63_03445 [Ilumatobacteraceae bacterium]|nr:hypothetical protein [Ilumatobacteraceae bacterium]